MARDPLGSLLGGPAGSSQRPRIDTSVEPDPLSGWRARVSDYGTLVLMAVLFVALPCLVLYGCYYAEHRPYSLGADTTFYDLETGEPVNLPAGTVITPEPVGPGPEAGPGGLYRFD